MTDRKHPTAAFWITAALVAVLLYVASFGPACWLIANHLPPVPGSIALIPYMPLMLVAETNEATHEFLQWYVHLWADNVEI